MEPQVAKMFVNELSALQDKYNNINKVAVAATKAGVQYTVNDRFVDQSTSIGLLNAQGVTAEISFCDDGGISHCGFTMGEFINLDVKFLMKQMKQFAKRKLGD